MATPTSTTPTTSLFLRLPSYLIPLIPTNPYLVPLYIFSALTTSPSSSPFLSLVDTSLLHISQFFSPVHSSSHSTTSIPLIKSALLTLTKDQTSFSAPFQFSAIDSTYLTPTSSYYPTPSQLTSISKSTRLRYYFLDHSSSMDSKWLKITYDEIYHILHTLETSINPSRSPQSQISPASVLNAYVYLKYRISFYSSLTPTTTMHESYKTLTKNLNLPQKRLSAVLNVLATDLGMIDIKTGKFENSKANEYSLSTRWLSSYSHP